MISITNIDPALYKAAVQGKIDPFEKYQTSLNQLYLTPNKNTILHVFLENQTIEPEFPDFVDIILEMCPPLLLQANIKGETPLHMAARYGHSNLVKVLIDHAKALPIDSESGVTEAKKMLRMTNDKKDTALHVAAQNIQSRVVEILTKEDPEYFYSVNDQGETPLYIATNKEPPSIVEMEIITVDIENKKKLIVEMENRKKVIDEILGNCISVDYGGPNGRTALHAAIMMRDFETTKKILDREKNLTKTTDQNGWSPLHYAAYFCTDWDAPSVKLVKLLLEHDVSAAYIGDTDKKRTALHIAALLGNLKAMKQIISCCPNCGELVDKRGWNALHYAVASKSRRVFVRSLGIPELGRYINEEDNKGNTPFHLRAALARKQEDRRFGWEYTYEKMKCGLNKQNLSIKGIYEGNFAEIQEEILESIEDVGSGPLGRITVLGEPMASPPQEYLNKAREAHLVVAALIATVTFAAAFTLPGGYKNEQGPNQGTAILTKKAAFIVFVISDAIAMVLSISAVFSHFWMALLPAIDDEDEDKSVNLFSLAAFLTMIAMGFMVIAFITGTFVVLATSLGLAITTCFIGLTFFLFMFIVFWVVYHD